MNLSSQPNSTSLKAKNEISLVLNNGKKIKTTIGPVFLFKDDNVEDKKVAVLIKKNVGKAYYRNYIKRIIRYYVRSEFTLFEKFNRVIFLYGYTGEKIKYEFLKENYNKALKSV
jgi:ribonuclease P protein component